MTTSSDIWPTELRVRDGGGTLRIAFDNGQAFDLPAEFLRVMSPSAEVQGHAPGERKTVPGKRGVVITDVVPTGNYAVRLVFSDSHSTGIFTWTHLATLGAEHDARWNGYLAELAAKGFRRDP